jgi:hypothetical protein
LRLIIRREINSFFYRIKAPITSKMDGRFY